MFKTIKYESSEIKLKLLSIWEDVEVRKNISNENLYTEMYLLEAIKYAIVSIDGKQIEDREELSKIIDDMPSTLVSTISTEYLVFLKECETIKDTIKYKPLPEIKILNAGRKNIDLKPIHIPDEEEDLKTQYAQPETAEHFLTSRYQTQEQLNTEGYKISKEVLGGQPLESTK